MTNNCFRIGYDPENQEYYLEVYGPNSDHLGSRSFSYWNELLGFLSTKREFLRKVAENKITAKEAIGTIRRWPNSQVTVKTMTSKIDWIRMEKRIRYELRLVNQQCVSEDHLRDALTTIDEIIAHETGKKHELSPGRLSGDLAALINRQEWR